MISVAIATYNGEKYILEQLQSISKQSVLPDEVVISDDCSTDQTLKLIENFSKTAPYKIVVLTHPSNVGYSRNFELALKATNGDYIFISDQDDVWFQNKIEKVLKAFDDNPNAFVVAHDAICTDANLISQNKTLFNLDIEHKRAFGTAMHGCLTCLKKEFLKAAQRLPTDKDSHDGWFYYLSSELKIRNIIKEPLMFYRRHPKAVTYCSSNNAFAFFLKLKKQIVNAINNLIETHSSKKLEEKLVRAQKKQQSVSFFIKELEANNSIKKIDLSLIQKIHSETNIKANALQERHKAISVTGIKRIKAILKAYKSGAYKPFKGIRTACDDLFRF